MLRHARSLLTRPIDRRSLLAGVVLPAAAYLGVRTYQVQRPVAVSPLARAVGTAKGENVGLLAILVSSSSCAGNTFPGFTESVQQLAWVIQSRAAEGGISHHVVGVAIDPLATNGWQYLQSIGPFHEVVAGGGWTNTAAMKYMWEDRQLPPQVPQLLILRRVTHQTDGSITVLDAQTLQHLRSASEIVEWFEAGSPLEV